MKSTWAVLVVYENEQAREQAVSFCDRLVERFWAKFWFDVSWSSYGSLEDRQNAEQFARKAGEADIIVFSHLGQRDFSWPMRVWVETWLTIRGEREGKLVGLCTAPSTIKAPTGFAYLRQVAHRAGMDFVTEVPQTITDTMPNSPDMVVSRARQVTSVLDGILHQPTRPRAL